MGNEEKRREEGTVKAVRGRGEEGLIVGVDTLSQLIVRTRHSSTTVKRSVNVCCTAKVHLKTAPHGCTIGTTSGVIFEILLDN